MRPEQPPIPDWARRERQADLAWIAENLDVFWTAATSAFEDAGRGAIVVDVTSQSIPGAGHPFGYFSQEQIAGGADADARRIVSEYDPIQELVVVLLKPGKWVSTYRMLVSETEATGRDFRYLQQREITLREATAENGQLLSEDAARREAAGEPDPDPALRSDVERILQRSGEDETSSRPDLEPPDLETLMAWEVEGGCEAACPHDCWIEPDGTCQHGHPSWLLKLGLI